MTSRWKVPVSHGHSRFFSVLTTPREIFALSEDCKTEWKKADATYDAVSASDIDFRRWNPFHSFKDERSSRNHGQAGHGTLGDAVHGVSGGRVLEVGASNLARPSSRSPAPSDQQSA